MSDVMRFADIKERFRKFRDIEVAMLQTLDALSDQERIRESVPVRSPEPECVHKWVPYKRRAGWDICSHCSLERVSPITRPPEPAGPTLAEQLDYVRNKIRSRGNVYGAEDQLLRAILASLERLARESDDGR